MNTVLLFSPVVMSPDARRTLGGAQDAAVRMGVHVQIVALPPTETLVRELRRLWSPLGAIVDCGSDWGPIPAALFGDLPTVLLHHDPETLPADALSVRHDSVETGRTAARELLSTGRRHFAFVHNATRTFWSDIRGKSFAEAIGLHGFRCHVMPSSGNGDGDGGTWQRRLRTFLHTLPKPCAVFAANDRTAVELLAAARHEGFDVPETIAVLGVDNDENLCERTIPALSSIEPDFRRAGDMAIRLLLDVANNRSGRDGGAATRDSGTAGAMIFGDLRVVRRASTRIVAMRDARVSDALELIRREACAGLRAERVAALFPGTRRQTDLRFRRAVGRTIAEEIRAVQLEEAKRLLADPARPITTIGDFCGFSTPGSLRKFFRRETGMSMREWRREHA